MGAIIEELGLAGGGDGFLAMVEREMPALVERWQQYRSLGG